MTDQHFLPGKDASLEQTINMAEARLAAIGVLIECTNWLNPAPDCWSVHLHIKDMPWLYTNGKGCSRSACYASALGELFERLSTRYLFSDFYLEGLKKTEPVFHAGEHWHSCHGGLSAAVEENSGLPVLTPALRQFYDPEGELQPEDLLDNNSDAANGDHDGVICTLPFTRLRDETIVHFPVSLLNNLYVSNGMAAGNSVAECRAQALAEIIERYVKNRIISAGMALPDIPSARLQQKHYYSTVLKLKEQGFLVRVKDASLGGRFPVICVLLTDPSSAGAYAAFGASSRFDVAVERTLTELLQGRNLATLHSFALPSHDMAAVADPFNLESHFVDSDGLLGWRMFCRSPDFKYAEWDFTGSTEAEYQHLLQLIQNEGFEPYVTDYRELGMYCCRFVVPGMSEIYPIDDLIFNNRNRGAQLRPLLLRLPHADEDELTALQEVLESEGFQEQQKITELIGVIFDPSSAWETLTIGELKAMVNLALANTADAMHWTSWCVEYGRLSETRTRHYQAISAILGFDLDDTPVEEYLPGLSLFFKEEELSEAMQVVRGDKKWAGLHFAKSWREISQRHEATLVVYEQLLRQSQK